MLDFYIFDNLVVTSFANIEKFTPERENAILITSDNCKTRNGESFGRISFRQDESAVLGVSAASIVRIFKLYNTRNSERCKLMDVHANIALTHRDRLVPSVFLSIWSCLNLAQFKTLSMIPVLATVKRIVRGWIEHLHAGKVFNWPFLMNSSDNSHLLPNADDLSVRFSLVWESKAGFSMRAFTKIHMWFLIWNGLTGAALFFFFIWSILFTPLVTSN